MNLILHQFKTDLRHFRGRLLILWLAFAAEPVAASINSLPAGVIGTLQILLLLWQAFFALALIASLVQSDPLVGTSATWLTRPLRRWHVFGAKSAFLILCVLAPRLVFQAAGWVARGYSLHLCAAAAAESLLISSAFVFGIATLAALSRDLPRFFLAIGITAGGFFLAFVAIEMLARAGILKHSYSAWRELPSFDASRQAAAYIALATGVVLAWSFQIATRLRRGSMMWLAAGLVAVPVIATSWSANFLKPKLLSSAPLTLTLVHTNEPPPAPGCKLLFSEFLVGPVPDKEVAVAQDVSGMFVINNERQAISLPPLPFGPGGGGRTRPADSRQSDEYLRVIKSFFPTNVLWFDANNFNGFVGAFADQSLMTRLMNRSNHVTLKGELELDLYAVKKIADVPLRHATLVVAPGTRVTIQRATLVDDTILIALDECVTSLLFDNDVDTTSMRERPVRGTSCSYVLYHAGSGEAFAVSQSYASGYFPALLSGELHSSLNLRFPYQALRERLAGLTAEQWMHEARLFVFASEYRGSSKLAFHDDNYVWPGYEQFRQDSDKLAGAAAIAKAALPPNPTDEQRADYVNEILLNIPASWDDALRQKVSGKFMALGTAGLPALLRRLPMDERIESWIVDPVIEKLITREQLPELRSALQRDNDAILVFMNKKWQADARDVLIANLGDHRHWLSPESLRIIAEAKDPATYAELRWHFLQMNYGHDHVLRALEQCPGFDTAALIRDAWQRARLGLISTYDLAPDAARLGLPDALTLATIRVENSGDNKTSQREVNQLAALTGYEGPTNQTLAWISANLGRFQFNDAQKRYVLQP